MPVLMFPIDDRAKGLSVASPLVGDEHGTRYDDAPGTNPDATQVYTVPYATVNNPGGLGES